MTTTTNELAPSRRQATGVVPDPISRNPVAIKTILVPLDFSRASMQSVSYAVSLAKKFSASIHLVHVEAPDEACSVAGAGQVMRETAESVAALHERLAGIRRKHVRAFWPENCHVRGGHAYREICDLAKFML
jgi:nucleotide-binding universal stress UspA family protein